MQRMLRIIGFSTASLLIACGIAILSGLLPVYLPSNFRLMFGIVLIVYGVFRVITLYTKPAANEHNDDNIIQ